MAVSTVSNVGSQLNLRIRQGSDFKLTLTFMDAEGVVLDLTGTTARGQIRDAYNSAEAIDFAFDIDVPTSGTLVMSLTSAQTSSLTCGPDEKSPQSKKVYDIEFVDSLGSVSSPLFGDVIVFREITR